ncbi:hypothetical protein CVD25_05405 [Bacillus canaveralius]|uniref:Uncharacterized protein n=1 Tax=Bacillus canaveralius TaxID=1403243 RepID=A0A2N5GL83_9BACI|nr:hypothetical protein [Bacillus canaveralius]PLR82325.1 hypothetical protein CU635_12305 [Bacillus canaveralius]PLR99438.1 hypothetical protein CVD25_05405 [Bacillus canaveralius]RSK49124.1 hypothetical protein EJA13_16305 [Bacillus canaveralius]
MTNQGELNKDVAEIIKELIDSRVTASSIIAIVNLLIDKGIINSDEYQTEFRNILKGMDNE